MVRMTLLAASYWVSVWVKTLSLVTVPASLQDESPPPSVVYVLVVRPAPSYWAFITSPPGALDLITSPRWLYQVLLVSA